MAKTLSIEAGDRLTKVCVIGRKSGRQHIFDSFMFATPPQSVTDGVISAPDVLAEELKAQLAAHKIKERDAVFSIASGRIATREVTLPDAKDKLLAGIIQNSAADYFPVDVSKYHVAYSLLDRFGEGEEKSCRVMVYAAPLTLLEGIFLAADKAGLRVKAIDCGGNGQQHVFTTTVPKGVSMLVDVDCTNTYVTFITEGKLTLQRSFAFGGDELVTAYMSAATAHPAPASIPQTEYAHAGASETERATDNATASDAIPEGEISPDTDAAPATEAADGETRESAPATSETKNEPEEEPADDYLRALDKCCTEEVLNCLTRQDVDEELGRLASSIARSTDYFRSGHWQTPVERVVLSGPCRKLYGLRELIAEGAGLPAVYMDELSELSGVSGGAEGLAPYVSCFGATLSPIDLMPPELAKRKKKAAHAKPKESGGQGASGALLCVGLILISGALCAKAILSYNDAEAEKAELETRIAELSYTRDVYNNYLSYMDNEQALISLDEAIVSPNDTLTALIAELEAKMPSSIVTLSASCTREGVTMSIVVPTYEDAAVVLVQLRTFESLADIQLGSVVRSQDEAGQECVNFEVTCAYGENPWLYVPEETIVPSTADEDADPSAGTPTDLVTPENVTPTPDPYLGGSSPTDLQEGDVVDIPG